MGKTVRNISVIVLYDNKRKILLQLKDEGYERYPNHWCFFGGGIEGEETSEAAVYRETLEELDYKLKNPRKLMIYSFDLDSFSGKIHVFTEKYDDNYLLKLNEGKGLGWFYMKNALKLKLTPNTRGILAHLIRNSKELK